MISSNTPSPKYAISRLVIIALALIFLLGSVAPAYAAGLYEPVNSGKLASLGEFTRSVANGRPDSLVGVYITGKFAFPVVQQPASDPGFVSQKDGVLTQFGLASDYGSIGLLAHNFLSGSAFFDLQSGDRVVLVYGDGSLKYYEVKAARRFQALTPSSPYSNFIDLDAPGKKLSVVNVFKQVYASGNDLVFQTCIEKKGNSSWGRLFVVAEPVETVVMRGFAARHLPDFFEQ